MPMNKKDGFSLIEVIIYISLVAVMLSSIVYGTGALLQSYQTVRNVRQIENSAMASIDRMVRDIRKSTSVDVGGSSLNSASGSLRLFANASTTKFYLSDGKILVEEDDVPLGQISASSVTVTSLMFSRIATTTAEAVRIQMTIVSPHASTTLYNFYNTAVLRGSYQ